MWETKKIIDGLDVEINKSSSLYHAIQGFVNTKQGEANLKDASQLRFDNIYETMKLSGVENILYRVELTNNGSQAPTD